MLYIQKRRNFIYNFFRGKKKKRKKCETNRNKRKKNKKSL